MNLDSGFWIQDSGFKIQEQDSRFTIYHSQAPHSVNLTGQLTKHHGYEYYE